MPTLLFLSDISRYLEQELYCLIAEQLAPLRPIYLESDYRDNTTYSVDRETDLRQKEQYFTCKRIEPLQLNENPPNGLFKKITWYFANLKRKIQWKKDFLSLIDEIAPSAVVFVAPESYNARLIRTYRTNIDCIYIQPAIIRRTRKHPESLNKKLRMFVNNHILGLPMSKRSKSIFEEENTATCLVWSTLWISHFQPLRNNIIPTGSAQCDKYFLAYKSPEERKQNNVIAIYLNKSQNVGYENYMKYMRFYQGAVKNNPNYRFIIKPHPLGDIEQCKEMFPDSEISLSPLDMTKVDMVLSHWSTVIIESISKGVPTVLVNPDGAFDFDEFYLGGYRAFAHTQDELKAWISKLTTNSVSDFDEIREDFIRTNLYKGDGLSTNRIVDSIREVIS